jgi:formylmethanofuran dehydrogenase subunit E
MRKIGQLIVILAVCGLLVVFVGHAGGVRDSLDEQQDTPGSVGGENAWNTGIAPPDWWHEIERTHGHVGPWNVLGLRIGQAAMREFGVKWGRHELDIVCYVPMTTPYTCMADGLVVATGNSLGRLDCRLAEVVTRDLIHVCIRRKDRTGPILLFRPRLPYLERIDAPMATELEKLSRQCSTMKESDLFELGRVIPLKSKK